MVGGSGTVVYTEDNGTSWTTWSASSMTTDVFGIAYGSSTWVFVGRSGTIYTAGNDDNDVTARTSGTTESLRRVYYLGE